MLRGSLDEFAVEEVLWLVAQAKRTGRLTIERPNARGALFFRDGLLYLAETDPPTEPLERHLTRTGLVTSDELNEARRRRSTGASVVETLRDLAFLGDDELRAAHEARIVDAVFELMRGDLGGFTWEPGAKAEPEVAAAVPVRQIVESASARLARLREIEDVIPSDLAIPSFAVPRGDDLGAVSLTHEQWRILALVDGDRTLRDISALTSSTDFTVRAALHDLVARGFLELTLPERAAEMPAPPPPPPDRRASSPFRIVLICTANRIRSPLGAAFLAARARGLPLAISSAGTAAREGEPAVPEAVAVAGELGIDLSQHRSRRLAAGDLADADLVLGFEARHVRRAIRDAGAHPQKAFTLREFVRTLERGGSAAGRDPVMRARTAVALASRARTDTRGDRRDLDIADPLGGPKSAYRNTALRIRDLCDRVLNGLFATDAT